MIFYDFANFSAINFQDPASPIAEALIDLHHNIFAILLVIATGVVYMLIELLRRWNVGWENPTSSSLVMTREYLKTVNLIHASTLETIWTIVPSLILMVIAVPSFALLYAMDEVLEPWLTVKAIGHQWYWAYEYGMVGTDINDPFNSITNGEINPGLSFDSYMVPSTELMEGSKRLLEADQPLVLPLERQIRFIITATDVLHAFSVNSLGIKVDAVPGRLNQIMAFIKRPGLFYGQCSELCGTNHAFMPIVIKATGDYSEIQNLWSVNVEVENTYPHYLTVK